MAKNEKHLVVTQEMLYFKVDVRGYKPSSWWLHLGGSFYKINFNLSMYK